MRRCESRDSHAWLALWVGVILLGCAAPQLEYRRSSVKTETQIAPQIAEQTKLRTDDPMLNEVREMRTFDLNEVALFDFSGAGCASLFQTMDSAASSRGAIERARRNNESTATATVKLQNPYDYYGTGCGAYLRWGSAQNDAGDELSWREGGLAFRFHDSLFGDYIDDTPFYGGFNMRLLFAAIDLDGDGEVGSENIIFSWPIDVVAMFTPWWLYGFGIKGSAGVDWITLVFADDAGSFTEMIDYGAAAGYVFKYDDFFANAWFGWDRRNRAFGGTSVEPGAGEYFLFRHSEWSLTLGVGYEL